MNEKCRRHQVRVITLDRFYHGTGFTAWEDMFEEFKKIEDKHYGLKIISEKEEILIQMEYTNIIWNYRLFFGSYKKKYKKLEQDDERWKYIEESISEDLKMMELNNLKEKILEHLKKNEYFEYIEKTEKQLKKYCI